MIPSRVNSVSVNSSPFHSSRDARILLRVYQHEAGRNDRRQLQQVGQRVRDVHAAEGIHHDILGEKDGNHCRRDGERRQAEQVGQEPALVRDEDIDEQDHAGGRQHHDFRRDGEQIQGFHWRAFYGSSLGCATCCCSWVIDAFIRSVNGFG